jgi:glycosyltransferase involved in cell wall biosynthesis
LWPDRTSLEKEIVRFSPDVIIIREVLTPLSLITQSIARKHSIRTIHYSQAPLRKKDGLLLRALRLMYVIPKYRMTPTLAPGTSEIGQKDTFYVPLFVAPSTSRIEESDSGAVRILFVGKYNGRRKKHLLLLKAIAKMPKTCPVKLTMVGSTVFPDDVYHQEIIERIKDLNLEKQVILKYDVDPMEMASLYRNHDVLVLPSVDEPFSISPLEAMAHGLPVIVTDTNGCQFHIREGVNGYVIKSNDINSLLNALKNITAMSNLKQMKRGAFCYVSDENNEPAFIKYFEQMIHQLR